MPWFDLPEEELRTYRTRTPEPDGLDGWWAERLDDARSQARATSLSPYKTDVYGMVAVQDVEFSGAWGDRIRAWYIRPARSGDEALPTVVTFIGYGGGRGTPTEHLVLPAVGFATVVMDTRGQGGTWTTGSTGDSGRVDDGPAHPGVMTRGIGSPDSYYYTRLYVDAARTVEVAADLPGVDASRLAVAGASQGGALALAAAALVPDRVRACEADVPFLCDIQRAVTLTDAMPYREVADFLAHHIELVPQALDTLRYVDAALLARRITADSLLSVGLMDDVCPPSTVFAAYNEIRGPKDIAVHPFSGHVVPTGHVERRIRHLRTCLAG